MSRMLWESENIRIEQSRRIATLSLAFPGAEPNCFDAARIAELGRAVQHVAWNPHVEILVLRSAKPAGFSAGFRSMEFPSESEAVEFANLGRRVLRELAELPIPTLAFIEGPCYGAGFELALACDYRLAVATADTVLSLGPTPCWGGTARLRNRTATPIPGELTAREAYACGVVDLAFCQRRAKIELQTFLDRLEERPRKRRRAWFTGNAAREDAEELRRFRSALRTSAVPITTPTAAPRLAIGIEQCPLAVPLAVEHLLRGGTVRTDDPDAILERLTIAQVRGRATPLELADARSRVRTEGNCPLVFRGDIRYPLGVAHATLTPFREPVPVAFPIFGSSRIIELGSTPVTGLIRERLHTAGYRTVEAKVATSSPTRALFTAIGDEAVKLVAEGFSIPIIDDCVREQFGFPILRACDELGCIAVATLISRLRFVADCGVEQLFYHSDRADEPNILAETMLGTGPRLRTQDEEHEDEIGNGIPMIRERFRIRYEEVAAQFGTAFPAVAAIHGWPSVAVSRGPQQLPFAA